MKKLQLIDFKDFDPSIKGPLLIHMTGEEWKSFVGDINVEAFDAKKHASDGGVVVLPMGPDPFRDGVVLRSIPCAPGCQENGFGKCHCPGNGGVIQGELCEVNMRAVGGKFCAGSCRNGKECVPYLTAGSQGGFRFLRFGCRCR